MKKTKSFIIPKQLFVIAFKRIKANKGKEGIDQQSIEDFEKNLKDNLYKLWNRMSSGCYFPPPVKAVPIPKKSGGKRILGIPVVGDRICQMVAKIIFEPELEKHFLKDSYGYRPNKSAIDAVGITRKRCWHYNWLLEFDIKGLFDNIPHNLLMKAVRKHTSERWLLLYIERWLKCPMQESSGSRIKRTCGTPQGGVISPLLSNLFMHYAFDIWITRKYPDTPWCRYADDGLIHCKSEKQAVYMLTALTERFKECGIELHPDKTKIVYCKDNNRKGCYTNTSFDFLGYTFRRRVCKNRKSNRLTTIFTPAISKVNLKEIRAIIRKGIRNRSDLSLQQIAILYNPKLRGWLNYFGRFTRSALLPIWRHFNMTLVAWAMKKFKKLRERRTWAAKFLQRIFKENPDLFVHWKEGIRGSFA